MIRFALLFVAVFLQLYGLDASSTPSTAQAIARGKATYITKGCYTCHGYEAQGTIATGAPALTPIRLPLPAFTLFVRGLGGSMPPFSTKIISDDEVADVVAYLGSLPIPPSAAQIPMLAPYVSVPAGH